MNCKSIVFVIVLLISFGSFKTTAQADFEPSGSFRVDIGLPATLEAATNGAFRDLMQGLLNVSPSYQYTFPMSLSVALGGRYTLFNVNEFKNNFNLSGNLHIIGGFAKVGREKFYGKLGVDYGLKVGYTRNYSATSICMEETGKASYDEAIFVEPIFSLSYMVDEKNAFTLFNLAYTFHGFRFTPETVCVDVFPGISEDRQRLRTSYLTFGFGYAHYF